MVPDELLALVEKAASEAGVSRNRWIRRALEAAVVEVLGVESEMRSPAPRVLDVPASPRASAPGSWLSERDRRYGPRKPRPKGIA